MCDTLCVVGARGTLFAKNSDRPPTEPQVVEALDRRAPGGALRTQYLELPIRGAHALLASRPTWLWGLEHGVNEHGVAIGNEKVWTTDDARSAPPALLGHGPRPARARARPHRRRSAGAAHRPAHGPRPRRERRARPRRALLLVLPARGPGRRLDRRDERAHLGRAAGEEPAPRSRTASRSTADWTRASADVAPGRSFQDWRDPKAPTAIADLRLDATGACVATGVAADDADFGPRDLVATLRDHGAGPWGAPGTARRSSAHRFRPVSMPTGTASPSACTSGTTRPRPRRWSPSSRRTPTLRSAPGSRSAARARASTCPCSLRRAYRPSSAAPTPGYGSRRCATGSKPTPDALGPVRERLAPVEAELWERADAAAARHDPAALDAYTESAWAPVEQALRASHV